MYEDMSDEEKKRMLTLVEDSWARMNRAPEARDWQPPHDEMNPGSFKPQNQGLNTLPKIDQTKTVTRVPGGCVDANGEIQFLNKRPKDMGVTNTKGSRQMLGTHDGQFHSKNLKPLDQGVTASIGSPPAYDVHVASQNLHRAPSPQLPSVVSSPAVTVNSGGGKPGSGIPTNVQIK
jgi:hypothetical protein